MLRRKNYSGGEYKKSLYWWELRSIFFMWLLVVSLVMTLVIVAGCDISPKVNPPAQTALNKLVIGYYPSWKRGEFKHTDINYSYLTHIVHAFAWPDTDGNLFLPSDFLYPELAAKARQNSVKMLLGLGGWGNDAGFPPTVASAAKRTKFISQLLSFCRTNNYDGVDLDWEFVSNDIEKQNFSLFVEELSAALKTNNPALLLSMAAPAGNYWGRWIDFERLAGKFDFISFMTYDYHGAWSNHSGHNSPLYSCQDACGSFHDTFNYARSRSVPLNKLVLGLAFFGRSFDCSAFGQPFSTSEYYNYRDAIDLAGAGWSMLWDSCPQVPYLLRADKGKIISFDDPRSISLKCQYVKDAGAAGVIIWEISQDFRNGKPELLEVVAKSFRPGS